MYATLYYTFIDAFYRKSLKLDAFKSNQQENGVNSRRIVCIQLAVEYSLKVI